MAIEIQSAVCLQAYNSLAIPATAAFLSQANTLKELQYALDFAEQKKCPVLILGEGSNTIFSKDFDGLVILNRLKGIELIEQSADAINVKVAAGESWHGFVEYAVQQGWYGLENLALIPGLVGAAPMQNIGAYGVEIKDFLLSVEYLSLANRQLHVLSNQDCQFAYRDSIFKHSLRGKGIICSVSFKLLKQAKVKIDYPALSNFFKQQSLSEPTARQVFDAVCQIRREKIPSPQQIPNAGSFFKNPVVSAEKFQQLKSQYPDIVAYPYQQQFKLAAAWLIDKVGWKGKQINDVGVHQQQALVLINPQNQSGQAVLAFAHEIQKDIQQRFVVELEIEPQIIA